MRPLARVCLSAILAIGVPEAHSQTTNTNCVMAGNVAQCTSQQIPGPSVDLSGSFNAPVTAARESGRQLADALNKLASTRRQSEEPTKPIQTQASGVSPLDVLLDEIGKTPSEPWMAYLRAAGRLHDIAVARSDTELDRTADEMRQQGLALALKKAERDNQSAHEAKQNSPASIEGQSKPAP